MGTFNNKIEAEFTPPKKWVLSRALSYQNTDIDMSALALVGVAIDAHKIKCKKGFTTDLASTPRLLWNIVAPWDVARAAIIHDLLYLRIRQYRGKGRGLLSGPDMDIVNAAKKAADTIFKQAMIDASPSVPKWKISAAYYAVRLFGRWSIIPRDGDSSYK